MMLKRLPCTFSMQCIARYYPCNAKLDVTKTQHERSVPWMPSKLCWGKGSGWTQLLNGFQVQAHGSFYARESCGSLQGVTWMLLGCCSTRSNVPQGKAMDAGTFSHSGSAPLRAKLARLLQLVAFPPTWPAVPNSDSCHVRRVAAVTRVA